MESSCSNTELVSNESTGNEKRKSRLRPPITPKRPRSPEQIQIVKFKLNNQIETLPVNFKLKVKLISKVKSEQTLSTTECKDVGENSHKQTSSTKAGMNVKRIKPTFISTTTTKTLKANEQLNFKLPEPKFRLLKQKLEYREPNDANMAYYRYLDDADEDEQIKVEYDMDEEDAIWLEIINKRRRSERLLEVSSDTFELMMDRLEKESFFQSQYNGTDVGPTIDEDAVCCICNDGECQNSNAILFCDMCNLAVHQECYGVPYIPEGQWLCRRCMHSPSRAVDCVLCPKQGGAFKQTDDNRWAHVICALWIPEVCFANTVFLEPIDSIGAIPPARWKLQCCVCSQKNIGACIQCHKSNCYQAFHVTCAQQAGYYMRIEAVKESTPQGAITSIRKTAYCSIHKPATKNGTSNGLYSSGDEGDNGRSVSYNSNNNDTKKTKKSRQTISEKRSSYANIPVVSIPTIPIDRLTNIAELVNFPRRNEFLKRLYAYWMLKRQSRNGAPLLRRLQNSNSIMRIDLKDSKDTAKLKQRDATKFNNHLNKLHQIRCDLEKVRLLLELVKKREHQKLKLVKESRQLSIVKLNPFRLFLMNILEKVMEKDINLFFHQPVSIEDAPDYYVHVKHPMDLGTMKNKIERNQYESFDEFEIDLGLIIDNCTFYNEKDTIYYKAAVKLKVFIDSLLDENRPKAAIYNQLTGLHLENPLID
ncbi:hypothetical protein RDWZM_000962 [Blomia tropicalis]|uniref:Peregrin n=1 Tax=Blomia tropicalis TaxID=40697 RepID=A0A9Q0MDC9_BLOTA|nr:Bromodomain and PHD finger-containing protein 1 [Blomia tropicalis]KAJ6222417.1 hypothetical protein RDWZM_000962 [Blomia tropicalis]